MACFLFRSVKLRYSMRFQVFFGLKTYTTIWTWVFSYTGLSSLSSVWILVFKSSFVWKLTPQSGQGSFQILVYLHYDLFEYEFSSLLLSENLHHNLDRGLFKYFPQVNSSIFLWPLQNIWTLLSYKFSILFDEFIGENFLATGLHEIKMCRSTLRMVIRKKNFKAHMMTLTFNLCNLWSCVNISIP